MGSVRYTSDDRAALARHVVARRAELRLSQTDVLDAGGPAVGTQQAVEEAREQRFQASTLNKIDVGMQWVAGSAQAVLRGGVPLPIPVVPETYVSDSDDLDGKTPDQLKAEINARIEALARQAAAGNPDAR